MIQVGILEDGHPISRKKLRRGGGGALMVNSRVRGCRPEFSSGGTQNTGVRVDGPRDKKEERAR